MRVSRSTSTSELLAATDAVDKLFYFKHLVEQILRTLEKMTNLILDSRSAFDLNRTLKMPEMVKKKFLLASIREEYRQRSLSTIRWTPRSAHLADAPTEYNQ